MGKVRGQTPLTLDLYQSLRSKGFNDSQIAGVVQLSPQSVSRFKNKHARDLRTPREVAKDAWPMEVPYRFVQCSPYKRLRDHLEYMASGGKGMAEYKLKRLRWFYNRLLDQDLVVEYDPSIPPNSYANTGGWRFVEREDSDGDLIIRVNQHVKMTDLAWVMFSVPPDLP
jgi:hypothetical protein